MTPVRLEPQPLGLESSTLPLSHCPPCLYGYDFKKKNVIETFVKMGNFTTFENSEDLDGMPLMHGLTNAFTTHG